MYLIAFPNFVETPPKKISGFMLAALPQHYNLNLLYTVYFAQEKKFHQFKALYIVYCVFCPRKEIPPI
jgi:hypothetical protein